jgi:hypothetical protein
VNSEGVPVSDEQATSSWSLNSNPLRSRSSRLATIDRKAKWAVLSFRAIAADDTGLAAAEHATDVTLPGPRRYFFHVYRWGELNHDPDDMRIVFVDMLEQAFAYVSGNTVTA